MSTFHLFDKTPGRCDKCGLSVEEVASSDNRCSGVRVVSPPTNVIVGYQPEQSINKPILPPPRKP